MLREYLSSIADAFRNALGTTDKIDAQDFPDKISDVYDAGYEKGAEEGGGSAINPEWTDWRYFSYYNNRNELVARLKYSDTSNATDVSYMFYGCDGLTELPLLDTKNATTCAYMAYECTSITSAPLYNTVNCKSHARMFYNCSKLVTVPPLDMSNSTDATYMFRNSSIVSLPPLNTSKCATFNNMCYGCTKLVTIESLDLTSANNTGSMLYNCTALVNLTLIGTLKLASLNIAQSKKLSKASIESVFSVLSPEASSKTLTLSRTAVNTAFETSVGAGDGSTSAEWTNLVASKSNWTISLS